MSERGGDAPQERPQALPDEARKRLAAAARRHSTAVDHHLARVNAILLEYQQRTRAAPPAATVEPRAELAGLSRLLVSEADVDTMLARLADLALGSFPACDAVGVTILRDGRPETAAWTHELVRLVDGGQYRLGEGPCLDAIRHGVAFRVASMAAERRWPVYAPLAVEHGVLASLSLPLLAGGAAIGALNLYSRSAFAFDDDSVRVGEAVAGQAAVALANARLYAEQRAVASLLQERLLPAVLPTLAGVELAARYRPSTEGLNVGGDWYDAFMLPDGMIGMAIGDVAGHSVRAATIMGQLRTALRAYVLDGYGPAEVVGRLDRFLDDVEPEAFATCCYAVVDLTAGRVRWANAGHPPPLLVAPDGSLAFLTAARSVPVGVAAGVAVAEATVAMAPGSMLLLYTDGLVERRGEALDVGMRRLASSIGGCRDGLDGCCDGVLDELLGDGPVPDDVALVALRTTATFGTPAPTVAGS